MLDTAKRLGLATVCAALAVSLVLPGEVKVGAQGNHSAAYCSATDQVFWFVHASDTHIGASGSTDSNNLRWLVTTAKAVIAPLFTVVTGDLTDSTNGNFLNYPNGPYQAEWDQYRSILTTAGVTANDYYDIPGNHDAYNDRDFAYYKRNAIQGGAFNGQLAWTKDIPGIGRYHFLAVNTPDNTGAPFSIVPPYGDYAGLDSTELTAMAADLSTNAAAAELTFVFGHHPVSSTGNSSDTYLYDGASQFVGQLGTSQVSAYNYGHVHDNVETHFDGNSYTGPMPGAGMRYSRVASLGKDSPNSYSVVSVDCNGVNSVTQPVGTWPLVLITAPVNRYVGGVFNPYAYDVPALSSNPIRALVFDGGTIAQVRFRIDGSTTWYPMDRVTGTQSQWAATWDASALVGGEHSIEVQAVGTTTRSHTIKVNVMAANRAPTAVNDTYSTPNTTTLEVAAPGVLANDTDPEGSKLSAALIAGPVMGTLTLSADGGFTYTPNGGTTGTDTFTYTASDGLLLSVPATVTITLTSPTSDTVTIRSATYTLKSKTLLVQATSSAAPTAKLTLVGFGAMTYNSKTKLYTYQAKVSPAPASVTVTSDRGGTAYKEVTLK
jgi:hypothetical protein